MSAPFTGIRSNEALLAAGWVRRHLAEPERAEEAVATYEALGFDVRAERLSPEDFGPSCGTCHEAVCSSYVLIYTRRPDAGTGPAAPDAPLGGGGLRFLQPSHWPRPKGYSNGVAATGAWVCVAGQVGWDENEAFRADDLVGQTRQALTNIVTVLAEAGAGPEHLMRLTWYVTDKHAYLSSQQDLGVVYREVIGAHYPAMSLVVVAGLVEDGALVEIEATAVIPEATS